MIPPPLSREDFETVVSLDPAYPEWSLGRKALRGGRWLNQAPVPLCTKKSYCRHAPVSYYSVPFGYAAISKCMKLAPGIAGARFIVSKPIYRRRQIHIRCKGIRDSFHHSYKNTIIAYRLAIQIRTLRSAIRCCILKGY